MEQPFIVEMLKIIFKPVIKLIGNIMFIPQKILKIPKLVIINNYICTSIPHFFVTTMFMLLYHFVYLNFHLLSLFKYLRLVDSNFELFLAFLIFYSFSATFYYTEDIKYFIVKDLGYFFLLILNILLYFFTFICFFLRLDLDFIILTFDRNINIGIYREIFIINFFEYFWDTIFVFLSNIIILLHLANPLSWLRYPYIISNNLRKNNRSQLFSSGLLIIFDFFVILLHVLNLPFIFSFIKNTYKIIDGFFFSSSYANFYLGESKFGTVLAENPFLFDNSMKKYSYIVFKIIIDIFVENYKFLFDWINKNLKPLFFMGKFVGKIKTILRLGTVLLISSINIAFFWRIMELIKNIKNYKNGGFLATFVSNSISSIASGITDILFLFTYLFNKIFYLNHLFINFYQNNLVDFNQFINRTKSTENIIIINSDFQDKSSYSLFSLFNKKGFFGSFVTENYLAIKLINFQIFHEKILDLSLSIISLLNILTPTFYIKLYNYYKFLIFEETEKITIKDKEINTNKFFKNFYLFPLISLKFHSNILNYNREKYFKEMNNEFKIFDYQPKQIDIVKILNKKIIRNIRKIVVLTIFRDLIYGLLFIINLITVIDPLTGLTHIYNIFKALTKIKLSFISDDEEIKKNISKIIKEEIMTSLKLLMRFFTNISFYLPLVIISILLFPFNFVKALLFFIENYYILFIKKIFYLFSNSILLNYKSLDCKKVRKFIIDSDREIESLKQKKTNFIKAIFKKFVKGWTTLLKFVLIHISIIRAIYFYKDLFMLKKFYSFFKRFSFSLNSNEDFVNYIAFMNKSNENKSIYEDVSNKDFTESDNKISISSNKFVKSQNSEIGLLRILNDLKRFYSKKNIFIFFDNESWLNFFNEIIVEFNNKNKTNNNFDISNTITKLDIDVIKKYIEENINYYFYLENIIDDNFNQLCKEFIFYPFMIFAYVTNPLIFYVGFLEIKSNDQNIFRQRKFYYKFLIVCKTYIEYFKIFMNLIKIIMIIVTLIKIPDLFIILYYNVRNIFSKSESHFKAVLEDNYEGNFTKDLNNLLLQTLQFYTILVLLVVNFILILRIPSLFRRVGRFISLYIKNIKFKYFTKKIKSGTISVLESTKINCFANIMEYLKPKELSKMLLLNKNIKNRTSKSLIWENLYNNYYIKKVNRYLKYEEINRKKKEIADLDQEMDNDINEMNNQENPNIALFEKKKADKLLRKNNLLNSINQNEFEKLENKFKNSTHLEVNLKKLILDFQKKSLNPRALCEKAHNEFAKKGDIPEKIRDRFIGLTNVVIEETFESIIKSPHLVLLPFKLVSLPIILLSDLIVNIHARLFVRDDINNYIKFHKDIKEQIISGYIFYNIQLSGVYCLLRIFYSFCAASLKILDFIILSLLRIISLRIFFKNERCMYINNMNVEGDLIRLQEYRDINQNLDTNWQDISHDMLSLRQNLFLLWQYFVSIIFAILHILILLIPTLYFRWEGINIVFHKAFFDDHRMENHNLYRGGKSPFLSGLNWWIFSEEIFNAIWHKSLFGIFYLFVGDYFLNIVSLICMIFIFSFYKIKFNQTKDPYCDIILNCLEIFFKQLFNINNIFNIIYPHIFIFFVYKFIARKITILNNKYLLNFISLLVILFPFYMNFRVKFSFFRLIIINFWGITSFMKFSTILGR